jgi:hypothetical protein
MPAKHSIISNILASKFIQHMSDRTNDEKLRILQERLSQIKEKRENQIPISREEVIEVATPQTETPQKEKTPISFGWLKYVVIIGTLGYGSFYVYNNIANISSSSDKAIEKTKEFVLEYNLNFPGEEEEVKNIGITASFEEEFLAKAMVNDLKVKGYKCDYFFLPNKSNSKEEVFKVFIGPYETEEEINQWTKNLEGDFEIIKL